jgi:hypothetical protein
MEVEMQVGTKGESSNPGNGEGIWKVVWQLKIPTAVKIFLWRACHNLLPTKANLMQRGVVEELMCPICLREEESIEHIVWACSSAVDVWCCGPVSLQKSHAQGLCFLELLEIVINRCSRKEVELFAVTARRIWLRRNDVVHGGFLTHTSQVIAEAVMALEDFQRVNEEQANEMRLAVVVEETRWQPPQGNMIKINWDAAIDTKKGVVGVGLLPEMHMDAV